MTKQILNFPYGICIIAIIIFCVGFANSTEISTLDVNPAMTIHTENQTTIPNVSINDGMHRIDSNETIINRNFSQIPRSIIDAAVEEQERKISNTSFIQDDSIDATLEINGFSIRDETESASSDPFQNKSGLPIPLNSFENNSLGNIPLGGFIRHGFDGKTRVFSPDGEQLFYVDDDKTEKIQNPSGIEKPASYSFAVPSGLIVERKNTQTFAVLNGTIIFTVINDNWTSQSNLNSGIPELLGPGWVEYAESNTPSTFGKFSSLWNIPATPPVIGENNILFNGIESSDPTLTYILQPVTAHNYPNNCRNGWNPPPRPIEPGCVYQGVWTGSAWIVFGPNDDDWHTYPPVSFSENDPAWGYVWWSGDRYWVQIKNERTNDVTNIGLSGFSLNPSYQQVVVAYEAYPTIPYFFLDKRKISSTTFKEMWAKDRQENSISLNWIPHIKTEGHPLITGLSINLSQAPSIVTLNTSDYRTKIGTYQNGNWKLDYNLDGIPDKTSILGMTGDISVVGDWNGYNYSAIGVFRPSNGNWYIDTNKDFISDLTIHFGTNGDIPVVGDWNGDGKDDVGIFRPSSGLWNLDSNGNKAWDVSDKSLSWGLPGDKPVVGDWNGDGKDDIGIFRPSNAMWSLDYNGNFVWEPSVDKSLSWGLPNDLPVLGDWNGNGKTKIGIFRPSSGAWSLDYNGNFVWEPSVDKSLSWGLPNDLPVLGDWNGNGKTKIGIFRPSSGAWSLDSNGNYIWEVSDKSLIFGLPNDKPVVGKWI